MHEQDARVAFELRRSVLAFHTHSNSSEVQTIVQGPCVSRIHLKNSYPSQPVDSTDTGPGRGPCILR